MDEISFQNSLVKEMLKENRSARRWRNIRFLIWLLILIVFFVWVFSPSSQKFSVAGKPYIALVRLEGVILPGTNLSARKVIPVLEKAFSDNTAKGVMLLVNSPGGSAAQASIIHDKIIQLKNQYHKKVIVVGEDAVASGAYLIASAADKIFINKDTLTGSIGVVLNSFGFNDAMQKLGITRRLFTAGENKGRLDPFSPLKPQDVTKVDAVLKEIHQNFIQDVIQGRGSRLVGDQKELFSGDFWVGQTAVNLGLADGTGDLWTVAKEEFGAERARDYTPKTSPLQNLFQETLEDLHLSVSSIQSPIKEQLY